MEFKITDIFKQNLKAYQSSRRALNEGGTASSKTWSILQVLVTIAIKQSVLISIVSESLPHLKRGAIRDFFNILGESEKNNPRYNMTEHVYTFPNSRIEFFGADEVGKVRGPRRDILFINEGNNVPWETARGLDIRTAKFTFVDWNPVSEFWAHEHWLQRDGTGEYVGTQDNALIHSTYLNAMAVLPREVVSNIESNRNDPNWWNIYGLGKLGKIEGLVYPFFEQIDVLPEGKVEFYGLDFGYSNDPTTLVKCVIRGDELYCQELIYEWKMTNDEIARRMLDLGIRKNHDEIWADSAEPKSIEEIYRYGFNIKGAPKGPDSVLHGHQRINQFKQFWTKDSVWGIKEQRNFRYIEDKNGHLTDKTTHTFSHLMDARRYGVVGAGSPQEQESIVIYDSMKLVGKIDL